MSAASPAKRDRSPSQPSLDATHPSKKPLHATPTASKPPSGTKFTVSGFPFQYLRLRLVTADDHTFDELHFRNAINHALREAFGIVGAGHHVDLLKFDQSGQEGLIRTPYDSGPTLRAALTLLREYQSKELRIDVLDCSPYLFTVAHNSRNWAP
ncbi:hypothetical protein DFJ77DRAFT_449574 [Powellomyces hirtus]|nr:hypothetical protein DFJ77DRAFT_449574 [Powellomyces hirtus]